MTLSGRRAVDPTPIPTATPVPTFSASCGSDVVDANCGAMRDAALATVASSGHTPIHVWLGSGVLCPFVDNCLFNPNGNFPVPQPPKGADTLPMGNAEVAFADTDKHAGMNLYVVGGKIVAQFIGYRVPDLGWCSGSCPSSFTTGGAFRLELVLSRTDWRIGELMQGTAILSVDGNAATTISGPVNPIGFRYKEVGATRSVGPSFDDACKAIAVEPATPLSVSLDKRGAFDPSRPENAWANAFMAADGVQLPAGTWDVTAEAAFSDGTGCTGMLHDLQTGGRVTILRAP